LFGVEDALVVAGLGKDLGHDGSIVPPQVGNDDARTVAFGPQGQQKGSRALAGVVGIEGDVQQVIGVDIHCQVDVHPTLHLARRFVVLRHQDVLLVHAHHPARADNPAFQQELILPQQFLHQKLLAQGEALGCPVVATLQFPAQSRPTALFHGLAHLPLGYRNAAFLQVAAHLLLTPVGKRGADGNDAADQLGGQDLRRALAEQVGQSPRSQ